MPPLVSIIIPAHNSGDFIEATLASVRAQTWTEWQAIVSDDGSKDDTVARVARICAEDPRVELVENPPMGHAGMNRNRALARARGEVIAFLDADDLWLPEKLERQLAALAGPDRVLSRPGVVFSAAEDFNDGPVPFARYFFGSEPPASPAAQYAQLLLEGDHYSTSSLILTREFADEIGPFSEAPDLRSGQDTDYLLRAIWLRPMILAPGILVRMRNRGGSLTARNLGNWQRYFAIAREAARRGELPEPTRSKFLSVAWLVRAEAGLEARPDACRAEPPAGGGPGWRGALVRSFWLHRNNPRRWPLPLAAALPLPLARAYIGGLKRLQAMLG